MAVETIRLVGLRDRSLDRLRGLAVVLMLVDHLALVLDRHSLVRLTVTRLSLPLFMAVAGQLLARRGGRLSPARWVQVVAGGLVASAAFVVLGGGVPDLALILAGLLLAGPLVVAHPIECATLGLIQALYLPVGWSGYEPGLVLLWLSLGATSSTAWGWLGNRVPAVLEVPGRRPLTWYVGHLLVLVVVVTVGDVL